jgi:hypothetical protein
MREERVTTPDVEFFARDIESAVGLLVLALLVLISLTVVALVGIVRERVVAFLVPNFGWIGAALAAIVILDRLTRPWFIERSPQRLLKAASTTSVAPFSSLSGQRHHSSHRPRTAAPPPATCQRGR